MTEFSEWGSFYVIVGAASGALIGLQFVVLTLISERPPPGAAEASDALLTPTIVHFGVVLLLSALISAPWKANILPAVFWCLIGIGGLVYEIIVMRRLRAQITYRPVIEDWLFHVLLPITAYALLIVSAFTSVSYERDALFGIGSSALMLLFVGIHNAWHSVAHHVFSTRQLQKDHQVVSGVVKEEKP